MLVVYVKVLVEWGYVVVIFDFRGWGVLRDIDDN